MPLRQLSFIITRKEEFIDNFRIELGDDELQREEMEEKEMEKEKEKERRRGSCLSGF